MALLGDLGGHEPKAGLSDPDEVPEPPEEPYVEPGELWHLGDHRILCGDATDPDDVARLLDGAAPTLLATDPPCGAWLRRRTPGSLTVSAARPAPVPRSPPRRP